MAIVPENECGCNLSLRVGETVSLCLKVRTKSLHSLHIGQSYYPSCVTCLPFIRSGQNHLARHSKRGKKTKQTEEEVGRQHQEMDRPGVRQVPEGSGGKCEIICGAPTTFAVKG